MRFFLTMTCALLCACNPATNGSTDERSNEGADPPDPLLRPASPEPAAAQGEWVEEANTLRFEDAASHSPTMVLACSARQLTVRLPSVAPIGSEERLSFGGGGDVQTLVADLSAPGDGVLAKGPVDDFAALRAVMTGGPGASYGAQTVGPLVPVAENMAEHFLKACG